MEANYPLVSELIRAFYRVMTMTTSVACEAVLTDVSAVIDWGLELKSPGGAGAPTPTDVVMTRLQARSMPILTQLSVCPNSFEPVIAS